MSGRILGILGAGHLGQQIAHYAIADKQYEKVVFFDDIVNERSVNGHAVSGKIHDAEQAFNNNEFDELLIGIGYKHLAFRKELFDRYVNKIPFGKMVHSTTWVDKTAVIKEGVVIYPNCSIDAYCVIENNTVLNLAGTIAHDTIIGKHCFLSPRVAVAGFVKIEDQCIIGINATIIDNITIAAKTQIGGGAVVIKSITESGLYVGNPSKFIR